MTSSREAFHSVRLLRSLLLDRRRRLFLLRPQLDAADLLRILLQLFRQTDSESLLHLAATGGVGDLAGVDPAAGEHAVAAALAPAADDAIHQTAGVGARIGGADREIEAVLVIPGGERPGLAFHAQQKVR